MGKNDIDKINEQIQSILDMESTVGESKDDEHVIFIDAIEEHPSIPVEDKGSDTKKIDKIEDIVDNVVIENYPEEEKDTREQSITEDIEVKESIKDEDVTEKVQDEVSITKKGQSQSFEKSSHSSIIDLLLIIILVLAVLLLFILLFL